MNAKPNSSAEVARSNKTPLRFITAASLFDGHDAAINIIRRVLMAQGAEVVHLGHNRSVRDVVRAALHEDADGIAMSSYQGGHNEYFRYLVDELKSNDAEHIRVVVGGGGTIAPDEIKALEAYGVEKIYTPDDGLKLGLVGMIDDVIARVRAVPEPVRASQPDALHYSDPVRLARWLSVLENQHDAVTQLPSSFKPARGKVPVLGLTGTGGAGKSSLTDELLNRLVTAYPDLQVAVLAVDPTRRRTGGALLGDRIRMNSLASDRIFMRSLATRQQHQSVSATLALAIESLKTAAFDLILVETAGIGQSDSAIVDLVDVPLYVMTPEFGAASQLEKIDMLDFADIVVINKSEKRGSEDALRDVRKQVKRNRKLFDTPDEQLPVFATIASQFNDYGVNQLFDYLCQRLSTVTDDARWTDRAPTLASALQRTIIPPERDRYLSDIVEAGEQEQARIETACQAASQAYVCYRALQLHDAPDLPAPLQPASKIDDDYAATRALYNSALKQLSDEDLGLLQQLPELVAEKQQAVSTYHVRDRTIEVANTFETLSGLALPKLGLPTVTDWGDQLRFLTREHLPGHYPFTAGVYPYRRQAEDPARMFAGEGSPERTNRRFHLLSTGHAATRLSTAFDSATLYGEDPHERPDIYGRIGNSGVSIATLDDMKKLYSGFDLCAPNTSVSMTINGPAPMLLAMFFNTAIDQQVEKYLKENNQWADAERKIAEYWQGQSRPEYVGELPDSNDGFGLGMLGISGDQLVDAKTYAAITADALQRVRGTVQADILKEDQAQNTCIFSTEFAMRMMGDIQAYFSAADIRNFYSVSISGYHIAEAGANPISQLAFTLANGFTLVEYYLHRGLDINAFAPNLSFFFSNGMDAEYAVIGRVARRIWARAMKLNYGANERSQKLKYHIQTSGRSLHAQEIQFNDIRTTLQALYALFDNCNSLHTNAFDEAITTPTESSVRRALAIQLIINKELGLNKSENPWQGSFVIDEITDLVEAAVYEEFQRLSSRGGVLGAMESMYQRGKIQQESLHYETLKHDGQLPIVGVNTFIGEDDSPEPMAELIRSTEAEKQQQVHQTQAFKTFHATRSAAALQALQQAAIEEGNVFAALLDAVKCCSLGQTTHALYSVGGQYRRAL